MRPRSRNKEPRATAPRSHSVATKHHRETARFRRLAELLAKRLRALRRERRMTIEQACEAAQVEPMTWYRLEHAKANPTVAVLGSVAAVFGLSVSELLEESRGRRGSSDGS